MKAYQLHAVGDLRYEDIPRPECPSGWCIVKVKAAGICSSDIPRIYKKGTYHFPTIPGHEFSGIVDSVADIENNNLVGRNVGIFPLIPCKTCESCRHGRYELCSNYDYIGSRRDGGFAEYVAVPIWNLIELDGDISFIEAAMMEPLAVSLHAVNQMDLKDLDRVAIVGTGMIAFAAAQWVVSKGVKSVTVIGRSEEKRKVAESIGSVCYATYEECNQLYEVVLEAVGSNESINRAIKLTDTGGTLVLMGNPEGNINLAQDIYWRILRKQLIVKGTWNSSYEKEKPSDWAEVRDALRDKKINVKSLVSHVFPQQKLIQATEMMNMHKEPYCKVMTVWNEE